MKNSNRIIALLVPLISVLLAFIIGCIIMAVLGANPLTALQSLWIGAFGNLRNVGTTLSRATPLIFTSLCACFAYRCGVFNLGGEGQMRISEDGQIVDPADTAAVTGADTPETADDPAEEENTEA